MSKYFNYFPKTYYNLDNSKKSLEIVTNILARFSFDDNIKKNSSAFYEYSIKDSDTPEIIASKYYGNPERHWIILLYNNIIDPQWDWPLNYRVLNEYIDRKYSADNLINSAPQWANTANVSISGLTFSKNLNNPKSYFKVVTTTTYEKTIIEKFEVDDDTYNTITFSTETYPLDDNSSVTIKVSKETQNYYDYENELNESKRQITLLKSQFVSAIEKEFKRAIAS